MVASLEVPQNSASARFKGSKNFTAGLRSAASDSRSAFDSETAEFATRPDGVGAKAAAEPRRVARTASFIVVGKADNIVSRIVIGQQSREDRSDPRDTRPSKDLLQA